MSSIEERLARDIAEVTGGVVVTESDLRSAREGVDERITSRRQRDRRRILAVAAAAGVVIPILGIAAFQTLRGEETAPPVSPVPTSPNPDDAFLTGSAPTPDLLQGVWRVDNGTLLARFSPPNLLFFDNGGRLFDNPAVEATYEIAGDLIHVSVNGGLAECAGQTFAMRASLPEPGALRFVYTQPGASNCSSAQGERWVLEQVLPTSEGLAELDVPTKANWKPPASVPALHGDWMAEGGGYLLEISPEGAYYVSDESGEAIDRGRWLGRGSELTLTSSTESAECAKGDRLVLSGLELLVDRTTAMRGTLEQNACGGEWASSVWMLLPHEGS